MKFLKLKLCWAFSIALVLFLLSNLITEIRADLEDIKSETDSNKNSETTNTCDRANPNNSKGSASPSLTTSESNLSALGSDVENATGLRWHGYGLNMDFHLVKNKSSVIFHLFTPSCPNGEKILIGKTIIAKTCFNSSNELKILLHGYTEWGFSINSMLPTRAAYIKGKTDVNVVVADWSLHALEPVYPSAASHVPEVGQYVAQFIDYLHFTANFTNMTRVHLIGFSLGAHVAGWTGRHIRQKHGQKLGRITGLDPAGPKFHQMFVNDRLTTDDAVFLDVIHGDTDTYGGDFQGHANFYPNGGRNQPGCNNLLGAMIGCGHRKTPQWFTESILEPRKFIGCRCTDFVAYLDNQCSCTKESDQEIMGESCSPSARGKFFLVIKAGDMQLEMGIYPNLVSLSFSSNFTFNNQTIPNIAVQAMEMKPTMPPLRPPSLPAPLRP